MLNKVLGQKVDAPNQYDKSILVREERQNNRTYLGLSGDNLPFVGIDIWNCWEVSYLTDKGLPVTAIAKIIYPANSKYIVESKSLKLYLNSFNMTKMGSSAIAAYDKMTATIRDDLSELLETSVQIEFFSADGESFYQENYTCCGLEMHQWENIDFCDRDTEFTIYNETPAIFRPTVEQNYNIVQTFHSTLLRSNCKITHQQDVGDVYIYMRGNTEINKQDLLKYIVSFRGENHFHEEICECIYKRLWDIFKPEELFVYTPYCRRGGIDICPVRASSMALIPIQLTNIRHPYAKTPRQ